MYYEYDLIESIIDPSWEPLMSKLLSDKRYDTIISSIYKDNSKIYFCNFNAPMVLGFRTFGFISNLEIKNNYYH